MFFWLIHGHTSSNSHIVRTLNRCSGSHRTFLHFLSRNAVISWVNFSMLANWNYSDENIFTWDSRFYSRSEEASEAFFGDLSLRSGRIRIYTKNQNISWLVRVTLGISLLSIDFGLRRKLKICQEIDHSAWNELISCLTGLWAWICSKKWSKLGLFGPFSATLGIAWNVGCSRFELESTKKGSGAWTSRIPNRNCSFWCEIPKPWK